MVKHFNHIFSPPIKSDQECKKEMEPSWLDTDKGSLNQRDKKANKFIIVCISIVLTWIFNLKILLCNCIFNFQDTSYCISK